MIFNRDIIIFSDDWGRFPSTLQHITKRLLKKNRVIWIGSLGLRRPKFSLQDLKRVFEKIKNILSKDEVDRTEEAPILVNPFVVPFHDNRLIRKLNKLLMLRSIGKAIAENNFRDVIIFTSSPVSALIIGELNAKSVHYFCLDDYTKFEGAFNSIESLEKELLKMTDINFGISENLVETRKPINGESFFLPQGVDTEHFRKGDKTKANLPDFDKPVIGFFGMLSEWVEIEIFINAAAKYPQYQFLIIGPAVVDISRFDKLNNLLYLGSIPYTGLPNYAKHFTVGLIPFIINELTISVNPLKLMEYLAMGIPVVSSKMPEVEKFGDLVFVAKDSAEFVDLIPDAVKDNTPERNKMRVEKSDEYSWDNITEFVSEKIISSELKKS